MTFYENEAFQDKSRDLTGLQTGNGKLGYFSIFRWSKSAANKQGPLRRDPDEIRIWKWDPPIQSHAQWVTSQFVL